MEKRVGIFNDKNDELSNCLMDSYGGVKYKIYDTGGFGQPHTLAFQTNDKEIFIKEWIHRDRATRCCDGIGVVFTINDSGGGGRYMNEIELKKYLEENNL